MQTRFLYIAFVCLLVGCNSNEEYTMQGLQGWEIKDLHFPDPERDARKHNNVAYVVYEDTSTYYFDAEKKHRNLIPDSIMKAVYDDQGNELVRISQSYKRYGRGFSYSTYNDDGLIVHTYAGSCMSETFDYRYVWHADHRILYMIRIWDKYRESRNEAVREDTMMLYLFDTAGRLSGTLMTDGADEEENWLTWYSYDSKGNLVKTITDKMYAFIYGDKYSNKAERQTSWYSYEGSKLRSKNTTMYCYECDKVEDACIFYNEYELPYKCVFHDTANILIHTSTDTAYVSRYWDRNTRY